MWRMTAACALVIGVSGAAGAGEAPRALPGPGVVLTFDDAFIDAWLAAMPLFEKYGAHATFFISGFDRLSTGQVQGLQRLKAAGHAIGCHGLRHRKATDYVRDHSAEAYLADEITPAVERMVDAGLKPSCFAYPMSGNNAATDAALLKVFRHLRSGAFLPPGEEGQRLVHLERIFVPVGEVARRGCLYGTSIDRAGEEERSGLVAQVREAMERAKARSEVVCFYSHSISAGGPRNHLSPTALEAILEAARSLGLRFYTYDDLP